MFLGLWSFGLSSNLLKDPSLKRLWSISMLLNVEHSKRALMMSSWCHHDMIMTSVRVILCSDWWTDVVLFLLNLTVDKVKCWSASDLNSLSVSHKIYHCFSLFNLFPSLSLYSLYFCKKSTWSNFVWILAYVLTPHRFFLFPGQAPSSGHHSYCSGKAQLHPVPPDGPVLGPAQPQRRQGHEAEVQPQLQQELQTPLLTGPQAEETLQSPLLR